MNKQILVVWNPVFRPETILAHVELLRQHGYVWWGKFGQSKDAHLGPALVDIESSGREVVLFATNHSELHALRVIRVVFGDSDEVDKQAVPDYYDDKDQTPTVWFKVTDIRALSYDRLQTLTYLQKQLGEVVEGADAGLVGYDPYRSAGYRYPLVLEGPPVKEVFDSAILRDRDPNAKRFADLSDTAMPDDVARASMVLAEQKPRLWQALEQSSRVFLARALAHLEIYRARPTLERRTV
jgi:hypothetical protein